MSRSAPTTDAPGTTNDEQRTTNNKPRTTNNKPFFHLLFSEYLVLLLSVIYFLVLAPFTDGFATRDNFGNILSTMLPLFLIAIGQTIVLITGGIDLSVTSIVALTSITGAAVMNTDHGWLANHPLAIPAGIGAMVLVGALVGSLNGLAITKFRMPAFIVTLTGMMFFSGLAIWLTQSKNINDLPRAFNMLGGNTSCVVGITALLGLGIHVMLSRSLWGRWLYAIGHNAKAALVSGVPVTAVIVSAYAVSGIFAALGSVMLTGQAETGSPVLGQKLLLDIIGATVIGGTSLFGGKGKLLWTLYGVLFMKLIDNSLNLLDLSYFTIMIVKGAVILLAAFVDTVRNRMGVAS